MAANLDVVNVDQAHLQILDSNPYKERDFFWEQHRFARDGYLKINHLIDPKVRDSIMADVKYLMANHAKRRDFLIESTGNTPRYLSNVSRDNIEEFGKYIPQAYTSTYLMSLIGNIVKEEVIPRLGSGITILSTASISRAIPTVGIGVTTLTRSFGSWRHPVSSLAVCWSVYRIPIGIKRTRGSKICWWRIPSTHTFT